MRDLLNITVINFHDAPDDLKALSDNGGDEDYIIILHGDMPTIGLEEAMYKMVRAIDISGSTWGVFSDEEPKMWRGKKIWITAHA